MLQGRMRGEEWAIFAPFPVREGARSGRPPSDHRAILDAIFGIARIGAPWCDLDASFPYWTGSIGNLGVGPWPGSGT